MSDFINAAERLADVMAQENAALREQNLTTAIALLPEKRMAVDALTGFSTSERPASPLPAPLAERLRELAAENQLLLERALSVQGRIIEIIAAAIPKASTTPRYGSNGALAASHSVTAYALSARA